MKVGIILAAGKGVRFKSAKINKTASQFNGKPLLEYSLDLFSNYCDKVIIVLGAYSESLEKILEKYPNVVTATQKKRLGTGHAVQVAIKKLRETGIKAEIAFVGYGDHMMFYEKNDLQRMNDELKKVNVVLSLVTCEHDPEKLAWGRIVRDRNGNVEAIVEEKVANPAQKKIRELNAGFYCLDYNFLDKGVFKIKKTAGGECYFTDIVEVANKMGKKVAAVKIPFEHVGLGINTKEELEKSEKLYQKTHNLSSN